MEYLSQIPLLLQLLGQEAACTRMAQIPKQMANHVKFFMAVIMYNNLVFVTGFHLNKTELTFDPAGRCSENKIKKT